MNTYKIIFTRENGTQGADHFIAVCGSFYITRDTMKIWLKLQTKSQKVQH